MHRTLTEVELEMMNIIWEIGPCTVRQIMEQLPQDRALAYTSVSTMARILEQKAFVASEKSGKTHLYRAAIARSDYEATAVDDLVSKLFRGEPELMVKRLIDTGRINADQLAELEALLKMKAST
jgi:predicted transcriptional regulator